MILTLTLQDKISRLLKVVVTYTLPASSKNAVNSSSVVLKDRLPANTLWGQSSMLLAGAALSVIFSKDASKGAR